MQFRWCLSWKINYRFDSFHKEGDFVHFSSSLVQPAPPFPGPHTPSRLTDYVRCGTHTVCGCNCYNVIIDLDTFPISCGNYCSTTGKLNKFIVILVGRNWSTYLHSHRVHIAQKANVSSVCASSVWFSHYCPFHIAMILKTVSTRNTKPVKIAIEPIARAFATP